MPTPTPTPTRTFLDFSTIKRDYSPGTGQYYGYANPKLVVIANQDDVAAAKSLQISPRAYQGITETDFDSYFVLVLFQGFAGSGVEITRIWQQKEEIYVLAHLARRPPDLYLPQVTKSPYHVVGVSKAKLSKRGVLTFVLDWGPEELLRLDHVIP